jgi:hypothetical protein
MKRNLNYSKILNRNEIRYLDSFNDIDLTVLTGRLYRKCCERYGVNVFDKPTLSIIYPKMYGMIIYLETRGERV